MNFFVFFLISIIFSALTILSLRRVIPVGFSILLLPVYLSLAISLAYSFRCQEVLAHFLEYDISRYFCIPGQHFFFGLPVYSILRRLSAPISISFGIYVIIIQFLCIDLINKYVRAAGIRLSSALIVLYGTLMYSFFVISPWGQYGLLNFSAQFIALLLILWSMLEYLGPETRPLLLCFSLGLAIFIHASSVFIVVIYFALVNFASFKLFLVLLFSKMRIYTLPLLTMLTLIVLLFSVVAPSASLYQYLIELGSASSSSSFSVFARFSAVILISIMFLVYSPFCSSNTSPSRSSSFALLTFNRLVALSLGISLFSLIVFPFLSLLSLRFLFYSEWILVVSLTFSLLLPYSASLGKNIPCIPREALPRLSSYIISFRLDLPALACLSFVCLSLFSYIFSRTASLSDIMTIFVDN